MTFRNVVVAVLLLRSTTITTTTPVDPLVSRIQGYLDGVAAKYGVGVGLGWVDSTGREFGVGSGMRAANTSRIRLRGGFNVNSTVVLGSGT
jgi:hypothetical protein